MKLFKRHKKVDVTFHREFESQGVLFSIKKQESAVDIPIKFTVSELKQLDILEELQLLEDLLADGMMQKIGTGKYLMRYDDIYELDQEQSSILNIPSATTPITIELDNEGFVGINDFKFTPKLSSNQYNHLHKIGRRKGAVIELPSEEILMLEKPYYHFLEMVDNRPTDEDWYQQVGYVAKVRDKAKSLNISLSNYIEREAYEFIDELDVSLERDEDGISFIPKYEHNQLDDQELSDMFDSDKSYKQSGEKRIFVHQDIMQAKKKANNIPKIQNNDIPKLVQNPHAFYDEDLGISLDDFSDRVRGLDVRVYKAQPFIHANQDDRGWFEYDTGFKIKDDEGNDVFANDESYFKDCITNEGNYKQIDDDVFVEIPDQADYFEELALKVKEELPEEKSTNPSLSNYILEIFENFTQVEYNKPLYEKKEALNKEQVFESQPPTGFKATLKLFQTEGFKWMKTLRATGSGGLLADDMGLGKTIQVIAYLLYLQEQGELTPTLLVLPKSLIENWVNELKKFTPSLTKNIYRHTGSGRIKDNTKIATYDIVLTTYHTLTRDQMILGKIDWEMVICDEAQAIKNPSTANSNVIKALKNKGRLALTGTPVENDLTELWSIIDFVQPGTLGSLKSFRDMYEKQLKDEDNYPAIQSDIEEKIKYIYLRRTKSKELEGQLPYKYDWRYRVRLGKKQEEIYKDIVRQVKDDSISGLQGIQKLKMLCSHPGLIRDNLKGLNAKQVPKLQETMNMLKDVKETNDKAIIFTEYRTMQTIIRKEIISAFGINPSIINGQTAQRQKIVDEFNQGSGFDILILSPKAAGTGLTITGANHVIHYTRWWNPAVEIQATDRVYRIGQEKDVHVYYPIVTGRDTNNTVEEIIDKVLTDKMSLAENVIVPSKGESVEKEVLRQTGLNFH